MEHLYCGTGLKSDELEEIRDIEDQIQPTTLNRVLRGIFIFLFGVAAGYWWAWDALFVVSK